MKLPLILTGVGLAQLKSPKFLGLDHLNLGSKEEVYLVSNTITVTKSRAIILSSGTLNTINGLTDGSILILQAQSVTIADNTGNLRLVSNFQMDTRFDTLTLLRDRNVWIELARSNNQ